MREGSKVPVAFYLITELGSRHTSFQNWARIPRALEWRWRRLSYRERGWVPTGCRKGGRAEGPLGGRRGIAS